MPTYSITNSANDGFINLVGGYTSSPDGGTLIADTAFLPFAPRLGFGFLFTGVPVRTLTTGLPGDTTTFTNASTRFTSLELRLTVAPGQSAAAGIYAASVVPQVVPTNFSGAALPGDRNESLVGVAQPAALLTAGQVLTIPLDATAVFTASNGAEFFPQGLGPIEANHLTEGWSGSFAVSVVYTPVSVPSEAHFVSAEGAAADRPQLVSVEASLDTGLSGPWLRSSRVDYSGHSGFRTLREEMVRDGFREGLWVRPSEWDPPDHDTEFPRDTTTLPEVNTD